MPDRRDDHRPGQHIEPDPTFLYDRRVDYAHNDEPGPKCPGCHIATLTGIILHIALAKSDEALRAIREECRSVFILYMDQYIAHLADGNDPEHVHPEMLEHFDRIRETWLTQVRAQEELES